MSSCAGSTMPAEEAVAIEEGMPGQDSNLLRRFLLALSKLGAATDIERAGPSKQHAPACSMKDG
jgi:hypothetical protein